MDKYTWLSVFQAVSKWLKGYEQRQPELIKTLRKLGIDKGLTDVNKKDEDTPLKSIDPFTFFCMFMKFGEEKRKKMFHDLIDITNLNVEPPSDFSGVPNTQPLKVWLFPYLKARKSGSIPTLWELFRAAKKNKIDNDLFNAALAIKGTGFTKLTQCLFYTFPDKYLPIDAQTKVWLENKGIKIPKGNWEEYKECLIAVKELTDMPFWEISHQAWCDNQEQLNSTQYTDEADGANHSVHEASAIYYQGKDKLMYEFPLNQILYGPPGTGKTYATTEMAVKIAEPEWYQNTCSALVGTEPSAIELRRAVKEKYDQLVEEQRIMFTTFHQSFSYEDFIEGIRANTDGQSNALSYGIEDGIFKRLCTMADVQVQAAPTEEINLNGRKIWKMSLGNTLEGEDYIFEECINNDYVLLGYGDNIDFSDCEKRAQVKEKLELEYNKPIESNNYSLTSVHTFKNIMKIGDMIIVSDGNHKFRAIAEISGDYEFLDIDERVGYQQLRKVKWLRQYQPSQPKERLFLKSLSQMTLYELKSTTVDHDKLEKLLAFTETQAAEHKPHVLIIDEINRGNISRIFGELITLLEPSKRKGADDAQTVYLPYSKLPFYVPDNLYVIGTMNTADKSLAQLDLALRRRFSFVEMLPQADLLKSVDVFGVNLAQMLTKINQRIEVLLDAEHLIGHSYFMPLLGIDDEADLQAELAKLFENKLLPLLQEYFFDDYQRIGWVLNVPKPGEHSDEHYFILTDKAQEDSLPKLHELFAQDVAEQLMDRRYRINKKAFNNPEAYKRIVA